MPATVEQLSTLERRIVISIPDAERQSKFEEKLREVAKNVQIKGFRKGKVPERLIKQRYGKSIEQEVTSELVEDSLRKTLEEHQLNPVSQPEFEPIQMEAGKSLEYAVKFEVYPEITLAEMNGVTVEKPVVTITEQDLDNVVAKLQKQHVDWEVVERAAQEDDQVIIDFQGFQEGKPIKGAVATEFPLRLGSGFLIDGFEAGLVGMAAGEEKELNLLFPENYSAKDLAGKPVTFTVKVRTVMEAKLPEINDEFAKKFDLEDLPALRTEIRKNLENETKKMVYRQLREQVFDRLLELNQLELPKTLVNQEIKQLQQHRHAHTHEHEDTQSAEPEVSEEQVKEAEKRVKLGLLVAELIKQYQLEPDMNKVQKHIHSIAAAYTQSNAMMQALLQNEKWLKEIEAAVLEEQVVEKLLESIQVNEKPISYNELLNNQQ